MEKNHLSTGAGFLPSTVCLKSNMVCHGDSPPKRMATARVAQDHVDCKPGLKSKPQPVVLFSWKGCVQLLEITHMNIEKYEDFTISLCWFDVKLLV